MLERLKAELIRRRPFLIAPIAFAGLAAFSSRKGDTSNAVSAADSDRVDFDDLANNKGVSKRKPVLHTDAEWRKLLSSQQYYVTRKESTDTPFTGTYHKLHQTGIFRCIGCSTALFSSEAKFDSGTGWPSFWQPMAKENITVRTDRSMLMERNEVSCRLCGAHQGHVFDDGPPPTNLRFCINESSLKFVPRPKV